MKTIFKGKLSACQNIADSFRKCGKFGNRKFSKMASVFLALAYISSFAAYAEPLIYNFDDEEFNSFDGTVSDGIGANTGTVHNDGAINFKYLDGYHNMLLEYAANASVDSRIQNVNIAEWGQIFVLETQINVAEFPEGKTVDLLKSTGTPPKVRWYITSDNKMHLDINNGTGGVISAYSDLRMLPGVWMKLYAVVDLTKNNMTDAIQMYTVYGDYEFKNYFGRGVNGSLAVGAANYDNDMNQATKTYSIPATEDGDMAVRYYRNLTIDSEYSMTVSKRCRGLMLFVDGDLTVNGTISMTARGCHANPVETVVSNDTPRPPSDGNPVSPDGLKLTFNTLTGKTEGASANLNGCGMTAKSVADSDFPAFEGNGVVVSIAKVGGTAGSLGGNLQSGGLGGNSASSCAGGGGGGDASSISYAVAGNGATGTCFSGGGGGGGTFSYVSTTYYPPGTDQSVLHVNEACQADSAGAYGGSGGKGHYADYTWIPNFIYGMPNIDTWVDVLNKGGGGAGNPEGQNSDPNNPPGNGAGGLLIIIVKGRVAIGSSGRIESNGSVGGRPYGYGGGGGGSGGGTIVIAHVGNLTNAGVIKTEGGLGGVGRTYWKDTGGDGQTYDMNFNPGGGKGGDGGVQIVGELSPLTEDNPENLWELNVKGSYMTGVSLGADTVDLIQRDGNFAMKTDFIKISSNASFDSFNTNDFYGLEDVSYVAPDASAWIIIDPEYMIKRIINPPGDLNADGSLKDGVTAQKETYPAESGAAEPFHGIFEINFQLETENFNGPLVINYFIKRPEDSGWLKIGQKVHLTGNGKDVKFYWDSHKDAHDWTYNKAQPYKSGDPAQFKFEIE